MRVLFFGMMKELAGKSQDELNLQNGALVRDVLQHFEAQLPQLREFRSSLAVAVNEQYASPDTVLKPDDEIAILPPVSGGADDDTPFVSLVTERIVADDIIRGLSRPEDGAIVIFDGIVRNNSRGRCTLYLDYESYESMALEKLRGLAAEVRRRFAIRDAAIVHRLGRIEIGESSVLIAVFSAHRAAAFDACRWLIDALKRTVPIWKKEHFADGAVWADGEPFPEEIPRANS